MSVQSEARQVVREWSNLSEHEAAAVVAALDNAGLLVAKQIEAS